MDPSDFKILDNPTSNPVQNRPNRTISDNKPSSPIQPPYRGWIWTDCPASPMDTFCHFFRWTVPGVFGEKKTYAAEKSLGCGCVALRYRRTLILGVTKSPTACPSPACSGDITRTRTVPTRGRFVFRYRLYSCNTCHKTIQTEETVKSADYPKRYVSRIEVHDRKPSRHDVEDDEDLGLNSW